MQIWEKIQLKLEIGKALTGHRDTRVFILQVNPERLVWCLKLLFVSQFVDFDLGFRHSLKKKKLKSKKKGWIWKSGMASGAI